MHLVNDGPKYVLIGPVNENLCMEKRYIMVLHWRDFLEKEKTFNQIYLNPGIILKGCGYINMHIALTDSPCAKLFCEMVK